MKASPCVWGLGKSLCIGWVKRGKRLGEEGGRDNAKKKADRSEDQKREKLTKAHCLHVEKLVPLVEKRK